MDIEMSPQDQSIDYGEPRGQSLRRAHVHDTDMWLTLSLYSSAVCNVWYSMHTQYT